MTFRELTPGLLAAALAGIVGVVVAQVPATERAAVLRAPLMDADAVAAALAQAGYRDVRDLTLAGAIWKAKAVSSEGIKVELRVNARNGSISHQAIDDEDLEEPEERED